MKIAVLGATGPSGSQVVKEALKRGWTVTAVVRNPDKITETHENLKVQTANIFDADSLTPHFREQDAVLSCLGTTPSWFSLWSISFYTDSAKPIVQALRQAGVKRFVFMTSWYTKNTSEQPFVISWVLKPMILGQSLKNMGEMEDYMAKECQDLDYTAVRCPQLVNTPTTGKPIQIHEGQRVPATGKLLCSRQDTARFMCDVTESGDYKHKCMAIASG